jgi:hypothetical protein
LGIASVVKGYRTHDRQRGFTVILLANEVRPLADFTTSRTPSIVVESVFYDIMGAMRTLCSRRIVHTDLSADTILIGTSEDSTVCIPVMWDHCIDMAMFADRKAKFVAMPHVKSQHGITHIDGCNVDLMSLVTIIKRMESTCDNCIQVANDLSKQPATTSALSFAQTSLEYRPEAVNGFVRTM